MKLAVVGTRTIWALTGSMKEQEAQMHNYVVKLTNLIEQYFHPEISTLEIVSGGARGVDYIAECTAKMLGLKLTIFPADWNTHGKAAGPIRNKKIADHCDAALILWDCKSRGTKSTFDMVRNQRKPYIVLDENYKLVYSDFI